MPEVFLRLRITYIPYKNKGQNQMQDKQIQYLAKFLNLTMHHISRHSEMLYEMDTKMFIINNTLQHLMWNIDALRYESNVLHYFQTRIYRVHTSL